MKAVLLKPVFLISICMTHNLPVVKLCPSTRLMHV